MLQDNATSGRAERNPEEDRSVDVAARERASTGSARTDFGLLSN